MIGCSFSLCPKKIALPAGYSRCIPCRRREQELNRQRQSHLQRVMWRNFNWGPSSAALAFYSSWAISRFFLRNFLRDLDKWHDVPAENPVGSFLAVYICPRVIPYFWTLNPIGCSFDSSLVMPEIYIVLNVIFLGTPYGCPTERCYFPKGYYSLFRISNDLGISSDL